MLLLKNLGIMIRFLVLLQFVCYQVESLTFSAGKRAQDEIMDIFYCLLKRSGTYFECVSIFDCLPLEFPELAQRSRVHVDDKFSFSEKSSCSRTEHNICRKRLHPQSRILLQ